MSTVALKFELNFAVKPKLKFLAFSSLNLSILNLRAIGLLFAIKNDSEGVFPINL